MPSEHSIDEQIGLNVKAATKAAGVTQEALAFESGIALRKFGYLVAGKGQWRMVEVVRVAEALKVDPIDLLKAS